MYYFGNRRIANPILLALTLKLALSTCKGYGLEKPEEPFPNTECLPSYETVNNLIQITVL